ncbi:MAG: undecaprenyl-diphosphate phosphatase [Fimbriiglobus sp.]|jgi:undecaprenyl-diphosphatase|nr:undecaprenyl-diphosphate phosphatase [Fimbriiglobus sp.]
MQWWQAVILGVVQGLTEFLPISSTAHLIVVQHWFGLPADGPFTTVIQLGTLVAVVVYFRHDIWQILAAVWADVRARQFGSSTESRLGWLILLGTLPAAGAGVVLGKKIKAHFYDPYYIGGAAVVFALLMLSAEIWHRTRKEDRHLPELVDADLTWKEALWIGLWQAFALIPGASRSGTCLTGALYAGLGRPTAARFAFLLSLPVMMAAGAKDLYDAAKQPGLHKEAVAWQAEGAPALPEGRDEKLREALRVGPGLFGSGAEVGNLLLATAVSGVVGYAAVAWLIGYLKKYTMNVFVWYRIALGVVLIGLSVAGVLGAKSTPPVVDSRSTVTASLPPP